MHGTRQGRVVLQLAGQERPQQQHGQHGKQDTPERPQGVDEETRHDARGDQGAQADRHHQHQPVSQRLEDPRLSQRKLLCPRIEERLRELDIDPAATGPQGRQRKQRRHTHDVHDGVAPEITIHCGKPG